MSESYLRTLGNTGQLANKKRIGELTGQFDKARHYDGPLTPGEDPPDQRKGGQWVRVFRGGAPGSGKRS